jgi:hypothetical protein
VPLTTAPSVRRSSSFSRSSENSVSTTARRLTDNVVALAVELDDLEFERLALEVDRIAHRTHIDQRTGQERADVFDVDGEATLYLAGDHAGDGFFLVERLFQVVPHHRTLGLLAGEFGLAEAVFQGVEGNLHLITHLYFQLALFVLELLDRDDAFALEASVDHDDVVADFHNDARDDGARLQLGDGLLALFKQLGKTFSHVDSVNKKRPLCTCAVGYLRMGKAHRLWVFQDLCLARSVRRTVDQNSTP